jgi:cytochrome c
MYQGLKTSAALPSLFLLAVAASFFLHAAEAPMQSHTYKDIFGKSVQTDMVAFTGADQKQVTPAVLSGYAQYNAYCSRCHGVDAVGGDYAPDLRRSIAGGLTYQQFLSTVMAGRVGKGMPSWAGHFNERQIHAIHDYIEARQLSLVPRGHPPSG